VTSAPISCVSGLMNRRRFVPRGWSSIRIYGARPGFEL
jgi:hypothetical protein